MRGSGHHHSGSRGSARTTSSVRTPTTEQGTRSNHASGSRHTRESNRTSSVAAQTVTNSPSTRSNHGSGSRNVSTSRSTARSTARSTSSTVPTASAPSSRPHHASGSHTSRSTTRSTSSTVHTAVRAATNVSRPHHTSHGSNSRSTSSAAQTEVETSRSNHGSGGHRQSHRESHRQSHRESRTAATSQRENHNSGVHDRHRTATTSMPSVAPLVAGAAISAISAVAGAAAAMAVSSSTSSKTPTTTHRASSAHRPSAPRPSVSNSASRTNSQRTARQPEGRVNHGSGNHRRHTVTQRVTQHPEDDCCVSMCDGCASMCGMLCALIKWLLWPFYALVACIVCCKPCRASSARTGGGSYLSSWWIPGGLGLGLSLFLLLSLVINSGSVNLMTPDSAAPVNADNLWTLFEGETQRVYLNKYVRSLKVTVQDSTDRYMRAAVFNFDHHGCPPLSGPTVTLEHDWEFDMPSGGFEYVHYNLYKGSRIKVEFHALKGVSDFYLLKGPKALEEIQKGTNTDPKHWKKIAKIYRKNIAKGTDAYSDIDYYIKTDRGQDNDIFTLVFDNASSREVSLDVVSDIIATTFDLGPYTPKCDNMGTYSSCSLYATQQNCVILEAYSVGALEETDTTVGVNSTTSGVGDTSDRTITLKVETYRDWKSIGILSAIPFGLSLLISLWFKCSRNEGTSSSTTSTTAEDAVPIQYLAEPLLPPDSERPPPTNPDHAPSAPQEEPPMVEAIPIDTASETAMK